MVILAVLDLQLNMMILKIFFMLNDTVFLSFLEGKSNMYCTSVGRRVFYLFVFLLLILPLLDRSFRTTVLYLTFLASRRSRGVKN